MTDKEKWNLQIAKHEKVIWNKNGPLRFHGPFGPAQLKKKKITGGEHSTRQNERHRKSRFKIYMLCNC